MYTVARTGWMVGGSRSRTPLQIGMENLSPRKNFFSEILSETDHCSKGRCQGVRCLGAPNKAVCCLGVPPEGGKSKHPATPQNRVRRNRSLTQPPFLTAMKARAPPKSGINGCVLHRPKRKQWGGKSSEKMEKKKYK